MEKVKWYIRLFKSIKNEISLIVDGTLKRDGKYSRTSMMMANAWWLAAGTYLADFIKNGLRMEAFLVIVGVALGSKISDALSNKLNK